MGRPNGSRVASSYLAGQAGGSGRQRSGRGQGAAEEGAQAEGAGHTRVLFSEQASKQASQPTPWLPYVPSTVPQHSHPSTPPTAWCPGRSSCYITSQEFNVHGANRTHGTDV